MIKNARITVKSAQGKNAIRRIKQEFHDNETSLEPAHFAPTREMLGRIAIVVFVCAYVAAHAWGIYKVEAARHTGLQTKEAATIFGE